MSTIVAKIDVTKIDKNRIFVGKKGKYIDIVLIETPNNEYGDSHMVVQQVTKEERKAGVKGPILGNAKTLGGGNRDDGGDENGRSRTDGRPPSRPPAANMDEDVPF